MKINTTAMMLPDGEYKKTHRMKSLLVLHHTVGGSAYSTFKYWRDDDPRPVGTAYLVDRDSTIYQIFKPYYWAYHLGIKGGGTEERRSVGVELASAGALEVRDGHLFTWWGEDYGDVSEALVNNRAVHFNGSKGWRGHEYYEAYTEGQVESTIELVIHLCNTLQIPPKIPRESVAPKAEAKRWYGYEGILHHAMVRADKSDLTPQFPFRRLAVALGDDTWMPRTAMHA
jgi:N-acetyl-anhydromuramyl-L-alanine amidase AmpD